MDPLTIETRDLSTNSQKVAETNQPKVPRQLSSETTKIRVLIIHGTPLFRAGIRAVLEQQKDMEIIGEIAEYEQIPEQLAHNPQPHIVLIDEMLNKRRFRLIGETLNKHQLRFYNSRQVASTNAAYRYGTIVFASSTTIDEEGLFHAIWSKAAAYELPTITSDELVEKIWRVAKGEYLITSDELLQEANFHLVWDHKQRHGSQVKITPSLPENPHSQKTLSDQEQRFCETEEPDRPSLLSLREIEILQYVAAGLSNKQIAKRLRISDQTVKNHITAILKKIQRSDRTAAVVFALKHKLISLEDIDRLVLTAEDLAQRTHNRYKSSKNATFQ